MNSAQRPPVDDLALDLGRTRGSQRLLRGPLDLGHGLVSLRDSPLRAPHLSDKHEADPAEDGGNEQQRDTHDQEREPRIEPQSDEAERRTVTLMVEPKVVQELILAQNVGDLTLSLRSSLDDTAVQLPFLDPMGLLNVPIPVKPKARPMQSFRDVGRGLTGITRYPCSSR